MPAVSLPANVTLYWRVRALGPNGPSLWSSTGSWYSPNPPGIPALLLPASGSLTTNLQPRLDWNNSTLPAGTTFNHYKVELSTNPGFAGAVSFDTPMSLIGSSEYTFTEVLAPNTTYYWRVRAFNNVGQYSVWSAVRNFRTALKPPVLVSPVDTFRSMELRPPFDWEDVPGAAGYTIQISRNDLFTSLFLTANPVGSSYIPTINLPKNTTLFWRVRTRGANGPSLWSDAIPRSFSTPLNPPPAPSLLLPALNALDTSYTPAFTWNAVLMPAGTFFEHYILQVDNDSDFSSQIISDSTLTSPTVTSLTPFSPNTKYYWRVRVVNSLGEMGNWSAVRYFRSAMPKPELSAPEQDATLTTRRPTFSWPSAAGATSYTLQVSRYANFSTNLISVTVSGLSYNPGTNLPAGVALYWRLRLNGPNGPSLWSDSPRTFIIQ
jgi:predicted phage tail protein